MGDVMDWAKRTGHCAVDIPQPPLFYYRRNMDGVIEQCAVVDGKFVTRPLTKKYCLETARNLINLALEK